MTIGWQMMFLVLAAFPWRGDTVCVCPTCPGGWTLFDGFCYRFYEDEKRWTKARDFCKDLDAKSSSELVSIHSKRENQFVGKLADGRRAWFGLNDRLFEGEMVFTDGTPFTYNNFQGVEPNNAGGEENCAEINYKTPGNWNDLKCSHTMPFVCQMRATYEEK